MKQLIYKRKVQLDIGSYILFLKMLLTWPAVMQSADQNIFGRKPENKSHLATLRVNVSHANVFREIISLKRSVESDNLEFIKDWNIFRISFIYKFLKF